MEAGRSCLLLIKVASEALGKKNKEWEKVTNNTPWFCDKVKDQFRSKKKVYLNHLTTRTTGDYEEYKRITNTTNNLVRKMKNKHWKDFLNTMKSDFYGLQKQIWRNQRQETHKLINRNWISKKTWVNFLKNLYEEHRLYCSNE